MKPRRDDGAPPLMRLRVLALVFGAVLGLTFVEEVFTGGGGSLHGAPARATSLGRARCPSLPSPRPIELLSLPGSAPSLSLPGGTAVFDVDAVAATLGLFGRFLAYQRPSRLRTLSGSPPEWRDRRHTFPLITGDAFRMLADVYAEMASDVQTMATQLARDDTPLFARLREDQAIIVFLGNNDAALPAFLEGGYLDTSPRPVVLVVLNGDNDGIAPDSQHLEHPRLLAVFAQNCVGRHAKVICTPIGLENRQWSMHGWTPETIMGSMAGAVNAPSPVELVNTSAAAEETAGPPPQLAFACFGVHTWPSERGPLASKLDGDRASFGWVSRSCNEGLVHFHRRMLAAATVIAPRGHGLDTLRAWEAFYLGRIIVTRAGPMDALWEGGLPVIVLPSWDDLTLERIVEGVRALSTPIALARSRAATPKLFVPHWACEIGKAARRGEEFCSLDALRIAFTREEGA